MNSTPAFAILLWAISSGPIVANPSRTIIRKTERALVFQLQCKSPPQVAKAINAMLSNGLIRYRRGRDGEFMFVPTTRLQFLGFRIKRFTAYDEHAPFRRAPKTSTLGIGAPFHNIQIDVEGRVDNFKRRAKKAGMRESWTSQAHPGLEIDDEPTYLSSGDKGPTAKIRCLSM